ncbi:MAG: YtxH domain-containing protein [Acidobacteriota bacterium]|nr:YtxH domain-containing protein [Acidobacteriota bacterium]
MTDTNRVCWASALGALVGGMFGYLYLTDSGREFRVQLEPRIDDFLNEMHRMQGTVHKAREAAGESWASLQEIANDVTKQSASSGPSH